MTSQRMISLRLIFLLHSLMECPLEAVTEAAPRDYSQELGVKWPFANKRHVELQLRPDQSVRLEGEGVRAIISKGLILCSQNKLSIGPGV